MSVWPEKVERQFRMIPTQNPHENNYFTAWNNLLHTIFPPASFYCPAPESDSLPNSDTPKDIIVGFEVQLVIVDATTHELASLPVLFIAIKRPSGLAPAFKSTREAVDNHMRRRMGEISPVCPLDTLHGVYAFGTKLSFYTYNKTEDKIIPGRIENDSENEDGIPSERWDCDIMEAAGRARFQRLVDNVREQVKCKRLQVYGNESSRNDGRDNGCSYI